jgi:hypothetical protein
VIVACLWAWRVSRQDADAEARARLATPKARNGK